MNLKYSILWFDDTADFYESIDDDRLILEEAIAAWGFEAEFKLVTTPDDFMSFEPFHDFDLIVVDYNLEAYEMHGSTFIKRIRDHQVFTEIVFYSSNKASDLWDAIRTHLLEGIFVANRMNVIQKIQQVAEQSVHKILDIENMRGILMAEVGDFDRALDEILRNAFTRISESQASSIYEKFHEKCLEQNAGRQEALTNFIENPAIETMISLSDSSKRWSNFNRLRKIISQVRHIEFGDYPSEILGPRNFLAHGIPSKDSNGDLTFTYNAKSYVFNTETGIALRKTITQYKKNLLEVEKVVSTMQSEKIKS
ncbi:response regulator [Metapseudomonas otitidis]|uniref:response regulator n=1 Tax=Metapseudomonas otitidis TaxID=319939 RepID=UPI003A8B4C4F